MTTRRAPTSAPKPNALRNCDVESCAGILFPSDELNGGFNSEFNSELNGAFVYGSSLLMFLAKFVTSTAKTNRQNKHINNFFASQNQPMNYKKIYFYANRIALLV